MEYIQVLNICIKITEKKGRDLKHEKVSALEGAPWCVKEQGLTLGPERSK